jgi:hypothetical protein
MWAACSQEGREAELYRTARKVFKGKVGYGFGLRQAYTFLSDAADILIENASLDSGAQKKNYSTVIMARVLIELEWRLSIADLESDSIDRYDTLSEGVGIAQTLDPRMQAENSQNLELKGLYWAIRGCIKKEDISKAIGMIREDNFPGIKAAQDELRSREIRALKEEGGTLHEAASSPN